MKKINRVNNETIDIVERWNYYLFFGRRKTRIFLKLLNKFTTYIYHKMAFTYSTLYNLTIKRHTILVYIDQTFITLFCNNNSQNIRYLIH